MANALFVAMEEQLETEKLAGLTTQANKTGEYEVLYDAVAKLEESKDQETDPDTEEDTVSKDGEETSEPSDGADAESSELDVGTEELRNVTFSLESYDDEVGTKKFTEVVTLPLSLALHALITLGITYGPSIVKALYKGVIYIFGKLAKLLYVGTQTLAKYIERRVYSFGRLKDSIASLEKTIAILEDSDSLSGQSFTDQKVINSLKIGKNTDLTANIDTLNQFLNHVVLSIDKQVRNDVSAINYLIAASATGGVKNSNSVLTVKPFINGMKVQRIEGYENSDISTVSYKCLEVLPSDVVLMAFLPREDLQSIEELTPAFNDSKLFLGFDISNFKEVTSIDYMTLEQLKLFLSSLTRLCELCIRHEQLYTNIMVSKKQMKFGFKNYLSRLIESDHKVTVRESLVEYVFLKAMFIDKVYLVGAMDVHDYAAKIISHGLSYVEAHVKKLS